MCQDTSTSGEGHTTVVSTGTSTGIRHRLGASEKDPIEKTTPPNTTAPRHCNVCHTVAWVVVFIIVTVSIIVYIAIYSIYTGN